MNINLLWGLSVASVLTSCASCRSNRNEDHMTTRAPASIVRETTITITNDRAGHGADGTWGFSASQRQVLERSEWLALHLPPAESSGPHRVAIAKLDGATVEATILADASLANGGGPVIIAGDGSQRLVSGPPLVVPLSPAEPNRETTWAGPLTAVSPQVRLASFRNHGQWTIEAYGEEQTTIWRADAGTYPGEPGKIAVSPSGDLVVLALRKAFDQFGDDLLAFDGRTGALRWRFALGETAQTLVFSNDGAQLAAVVNDTQQCQSCRRVVLLAAVDGSVSREVSLPAGMLTWEDQYVGLSGNDLWFYGYVAPHETSEFLPAGRHPVDASCYYERYELTNHPGAPATLKDATGAWADLARGCKVRAVWSAPGGHVVAFAVTSEVSASVVELASVP